MTTTVDDLADNPEWVFDMDPELQAEMAAQLSDEDAANLKRYTDSRETWRDNPAVFANHLTRDEPEPWRLWKYTILLAEQFKAAVLGETPRQIIMLPSQMGKGLDLNTPIPTPNGWSTMGELQVGDVIFGGDGKPCRVTLATEPRTLDCYDVEMHDGAHLVADGDHLWKVWDAWGHDPVAWRESRTKGCWRTVGMRDIYANPARYRVPQCPGIETEDATDLPIDPYALGVWLGDGTSCSAGLTCADDEILEHLAAVGEPAKRLQGSPERPYPCTFSGAQPGKPRFQTRLRSMGLLNNKHVPDAYMWAGEKQRLALLQGLMDTDGSAGTQHSGYSQCEFTSTNRALADGVEFLARSLGIRTKVREGRATLNGRDCGPKYRLSFTTELPVFRLSRKARLLYDQPGERRTNGKVGFKSVTLTTSRPTKCIKVDSWDSTYLAGRQLTVTHNTSSLIWGILWALDRNPRLRIMYVTYSADKAAEEGARLRDMVRLYSKSLSFKLKADSQAKAKWKTDQGGGVYFVGIDGAITGFPQDMVVGDDLIKGWQAAHSEANREFVWGVYRSQIRMRMQSSKNPIFIAGTRWHQDDIQARLMNAGEDDEYADQWKVIRLAAIAEQADPNAADPLLRMPDPLGRKPGELIEPERFDRAEVMARRATLGTYLASALEQGRPSPPEGTVLKREWWQIAHTIPTKGDQEISSWDMKLKDNEQGDFTVGQVWRRVGKDLYLIDQFRGQWNEATTANAVALLCVRYPNCRRHVIENAGYAPEVIKALSTPAPGYTLSEDMIGELGITEDEVPLVESLRRRGLRGFVKNNVKGSKTVRARLISGKIEQGDVHLNAFAAWLAGFLEEMSAFDNGAFDDQVDAMSQALTYMQGRGVRSGNRTSGAAQREARAASVA